jgi:hypothetical protein
MRLEAKARFVVESALEADVRIAIVGRADDPCLFAWAPTAPTVLKAGRTRWSSMIEFAEGARGARKQFQEKALEAIHAAAEAIA